MTDYLTSPERYWQRSRSIMSSRLPTMERFVLLAISDHLGSKQNCWPSADRLALRTGANRRTVLRALKRLEDRGVIKVTRSTGRANRYRIDWEAVHPFSWLVEISSDTRTDNQCHRVTGDTESLVSESHWCHRVTGGVSQSHPKRVKKRVKETDQLKPP